MAGSEATSPRRSPESGEASVPLWLVRSDTSDVGKDLAMWVRLISLLYYH